MLGGIPLLNLFLGNLPGCQITDIFTYFALEHEDALGETDPADDIFKEWPHVSSAVRDSEAGDSPLGGGHYGLAGGGGQLWHMPGGAARAPGSLWLATIGTPAQVSWPDRGRHAGMGAGEEHTSRAIPFLFLPLGTNLNLLYDGNPSVPEKYYCHQSTTE